MESRKLAQKLFFTAVLCSLCVAKEADRCFCKLQGEVDDCSCKVESVDSFNNLKIFPRLNSLLQKDYFRYWKVNLKKQCPFWADDSGCVLRSCAVDQCTDEELPVGLKHNESHDRKYSSEAQREADCADEGKELGFLNTTISEKSREAFETWRKHDDAQDNFCELDDEHSLAASYVDLLLNPERYTGYRGRSSDRVWSSIYNENCFQPHELDYTNFISRQGEMCLEKRAFYRMVSGLHTSINIHLSAMYYFPDKLNLGPGSWEPNVAEFKRRFDPETTSGEGPQWLKNLYFTYLVELRALVKAAPYLKEELFYTGSDQEDAEVRKAVNDLLEVAKSFEDQFDESKLFRGDKKEAAKLKREFKHHFRNISRIMDCVGCDKCKLWGKLQVTGMGTALKILFSGDTVGLDSTVNTNMKKPFQLVRTEIVALFNAFGRLSRSIHEVEKFRRMLS